MRRSVTVGRLVTAEIQRLATASPSDPIPCGGSDGDDSRQGRTRGGFASPSSAHCRKDQKRGDSSGSDSRGLEGKTVLIDFTSTRQSPSSAPVPGLVLRETELDSDWVVCGEGL